MAFLNRVGNALKQTVSKHVASQFPAPNASPFQAIRSMSTAASKLFVGGLSYNTDEMSLREAFSQYGEVVEARVITDRETGRSRGFGFVTFTSSESASTAMQAFDGQDLHGRRVRVNFATEKPRTGGFGGGYGGGFGGGYGGGQGGNYGGGGYQGGNYQGGGGNYGGGNYGGGGGYGTNNQYPSGGGGGYGGAVSGGDGGFGGGDSVPAGGSNYGGGAGLSSVLDDETTGLPNEIREPIGHQKGGIEGGMEDTYDENTRDDNDDQDDFANTRR